MKMLGDKSMSSVLRGFTATIWVILLISVGFSLLYFVGVMIDPKIQTTANERYDEFLYELTPEASVPPLEIEEAAPWITEPRLTLIGRLEFTPKSRWFHLVRFSGIILGALLLLACLFQLMKYYKSLSEGSPFVRENARRLKTIAWLTIGLGVANILLGIIPFFYVNGLFSLKNFTASSLYWQEFLENATMAFFTQIIEGFFILVIADVFRVGVALKEEQDLTV
jgi:hypothetical protein